MRLQTQLTLSHILVTTVSVVIFIVGLLLGYWLYLNSTLPAAWAADWAEIYADDLESILNSDCLDCLETYIESEVLPISDDPEYDEWIVAIDANGRILGSNYDAAFPVGEPIFDWLPYGIEAENFIEDTVTYGHVNDRHFALSSMPTQGWVYFHGGSANTAFQLQRTVQITLLSSVALGIIALIVSGVTGSWLSRYFGRKLTRLGEISSDFASGTLGARVPITGNDEINQLGLQYNKMADTIAQQIVELRSLAQTNAQLAEEAEGLARVEERNRLARDLHDSVKQQLFGINLTLGSVPALFESQPDVARERLQQVISQTQSIHEEIDQIIKQLRPVSLQDQGLAKATVQLAEQWAQQVGVKADVTILEARPVPLQIEQEMYRILQEALQNIAKHAQASEVKINLLYQPDSLLLEVRDNGVGFDTTQVNFDHSFGLQNMRHRCKALGGRFDIKTDGSGTVLTVWLPIRDKS